MKNNRKNRKAVFIKHKNNLRLGITKFYCAEKMSSLLVENITQHLDSLTEIAKKSLFKNHKLKLNKTTILPRGMVDDDFAKDLVTNVVILSRS